MTLMNLDETEMLHELKLEREVKKA